ncbi:28S rRNA (cytosine-C(5))-methyltransferase-like [Ornithodoros turicata]|uniref:28S rRNA (cytosine-C(5))-methyltransferase-like n=1 Tax=Ornithodoros turicata TaxID=34597 RepID=UPI003139CB19
MQSSKTIERNTSLKLPKLYTCAARILKGIRENGGTIGKLITEAKHPRKTCLSALVRQAIKHKAPLLAALDKAQIRDKNPSIVEDLAIVLACELLLGHKKALTPGNQKINTILESEAVLRDAYEEALHNHGEVKQAKFSPRYVRVNTMNGKDVAAVIAEIESLGFKRIKLTTIEKSDFKKWKKAVKHLTEEQFLVDFHVPDMLVFHPAAKLTGTHLHDNSHIVLHDKCSAMAAIALNPHQGSVVLDACAAPGIKTTYLASLMAKDGWIWAVDRSKERCESLKWILQSTGADSCVKVLERDFRRMNPNSEEGFTNAEYILLDPSCSGSGMTSRIELNPHNSGALEARLRSLHNMQVMLLKHAMHFPCVKRIVYSTCSVYPEENEEVIAEAIDFPHSNFQLVEALPEWPLRGLEEYPFASKCVRMTRKKTLTSGFFLAVFERVETKKTMPRNENKLGKKRKQHLDQGDTAVYKKMKRKMGAENAGTSSWSK